MRRQKSPLLYFSKSWGTEGLGEGCAVEMLSIGLWPMVVWHSNVPFTRQTILQNKAVYDKNLRSLFSQLPTEPPLIFAKQNEEEELFRSWVFSPFDVAMSALSDTAYFMKRIWDLRQLLSLRRWYLAKQKCYRVQIVRSCRRTITTVTGLQKNSAAQPSLFSRVKDCFVSFRRILWAL